MGYFMKRIKLVLILSSICLVGHSQTEDIRLIEYLYPRQDTMTFNCVYNSFHARGLHDTVTLGFKKLIIESTIAYCISIVDDTECRYSELASFLGSAMIFTNDSILLAPLQWDKSTNRIRIKHFNYFIPPKFKKTDIVLVKLHDRSLKLSNFSYENLIIDGRTLENCLKIKITEEYNGVKEPQYGCVWLSKIYGIVKWIRVTDRVEVRALKLQTF